MRAGTRRRIICPFHKEKTGSMILRYEYVNGAIPVAGGTAHCFSCGIRAGFDEFIIMKGTKKYKKRSFTTSFDEEVA